MMQTHKTFQQRGKGKAQEWPKDLINDAVQSDGSTEHSNSDKELSDQDEHTESEVESPEKIVDQLTGEVIPLVFLK